jgi:pyruvate,water dikinase
MIMSIVTANNLKANMDFQFRFRYETLRSLLNKNGNALQIMSDLEADLNHIRHYDERIKRPIRRLITEALLMAQELNILSKDRYQKLYQTIFRLRNETDLLFKRENTAKDKPLAMMIDHEKAPDPKVIGGKATGVWLLGKHFKDSVPKGFVVTTAAYKKILEKDNLHNRIRLLLNNIDVTLDQDQFRLRTRTIRKWITDVIIPEDISEEIYNYAVRIGETSKNALWAVRSSGVSEDGTYSFAGQFDTELKIENDRLLSAYKEVLASRFTERAVAYRINNGFREVDTPMAVLFMPMIEPVAAGVVYTSDFEHQDFDKLIINSVPGLAHRMVRGEERADTFIFSKGAYPELQKIIPAHGNMGKGSSTEYVHADKLLEIADLAVKASGIFGHDLDMEWALDQHGKIWFLQSRPLNMNKPGEETALKLSKKKDELPLLEGGITIFPGRAEGPLYFLGDTFKASEIPEGAIVLAEKAKPEFAVFLPKISALLVMEGNPVGHLATLVKEFSVPCIFRIGQNAKILSGKNILSVNAIKRTIYTGVRWHDIKERGLSRIASRKKDKKSGPLSDFVLRLNLLDPDASSFKPKSCRSVHDVLRFMHEMAVRSMFGFGDTQKRGWIHKGKALQTELPIKFHLIDLDKSVNEDMKKIKPEDVASVPFMALWRGISDKRLSWPERWEKEMAGMPSDFKEVVLGGKRGPRRVSDKNYAIVAKDYININARFTYHYAMVDAMVGPGSENNHVHFRFRGGGAGNDNRIRRARFLEQVLRATGFGVEQQGDMVTAWMRRYPKTDSEKALEVIGRLMVCARQLDAVLKHDSDIKRYAGYFLDEKYSIFS